MIKENPVKAMKWLIGIAVGGLFFIYGGRLLSQELKLGLFLFIGWTLGYVESRSEVGIASGYTDFFITGSRTRLYGLLLLFGAGSLGAIVVHFFAAQTGAVPQHLATESQAVIPGTSVVNPVNFGLILGSFLFGVGLTLNQGCGLGTLRNTGQGKMRYLWTLLFLLIGTIPGQLVKFRLDQSVLHQYSIQLYLPDLFGYVGTGLFIIGMLLVLALLARKYEMRRRKKDTYTETESANLPKSDTSKPTPILSERMFSNVFKSKWARLISVGLITLCLLLALTLTGEALVVTRPLINPAVGLFQTLGFNFDNPAFDQIVTTVNEGLHNDYSTQQNLGIILGASIYSLTSTQFSVSWKTSGKETFMSMVSGVLMGSGAVLASGCIVGALYSGIVNFSLSGWVVFASMSLGIGVTVKLMNGKISTIPEIKN